MVFCRQLSFKRDSTWLHCSQTSLFLKAHLLRSHAGSLDLARVLECSGTRDFMQLLIVVAIAHLLD